MCVGMWVCKWCGMWVCGWCGLYVSRCLYVRWVNMCIVNMSSHCGPIFVELQ